MVSSGMLRRVALVRTDVSEELSTSFIRETRIGELGTILAASARKRRFLQEPHGVTSRKTPFTTGVGFLRVLRFPLPLVPRAALHTIDHMTPSDAELSQLM
jgi:hypothetical protein